MVGVGVIVLEQAWLCRWYRYGSVLGVDVVSLCVLCLCVFRRGCVVVVGVVVSE